MSEHSALSLATDVLHREATALDERRWDDWLALFFEDCEFWIPTWRSEMELISDPRREVSHMYYTSRGPLEDRVYRIGSGRSPASVPLPRTLHLLSNIAVANGSPDRLIVRSSFVVHSFFQRNRQTGLLFGRYEHELRQRDRWGILKKKIIIMNDHIDSALDFYLA